MTRQTSRNRLGADIAAYAIRMIRTAALAALLNLPIHGMAQPLTAREPAVIEESALRGRSVPREEDIARDAMSRLNGRPLWSDNHKMTSQATGLIAILHTSESLGLRPADYGVDQILAAQQRLAGEAADNSAWRRLDRLLCIAAIRLITHLHYGRIDPAAAGFDLPARRADLDVAATVVEMTSSRDINAVIAGIEPHFVHYALLKTALQHYRNLADATPIVESQVRKIELTLERWRWLPQLDTPPIIVNIPQFQLFAFHTTADRVADIQQMPVIVGKSFPSKRTPVFVGTLKYIIFRPYWDVPRSIAVREVLPHLRRSPGYLVRNHFEIVRGADDNTASIEPQTAATLAQVASGQLRVRQRPGEDNALGLVKFVFPNAHDVYLHSTPEKQLFNQSRRAFSHGCIRVADPVALATYVLRENTGDWDRSKVIAAMQGPQTRRIEIAHPIKVMILYGTALATEAGPVEFFDDLYGNDAKLSALLDLPPLRRAAAPTRT